MNAIIYIRFSNLEQIEGASIDRQLERCTAMCEANGWPIDGTLIDQGRSAFTGRHREAGNAFGDFEAEAVTGMHAGKVLVVERLSRFSRQDYNDTYDLMRSFTKRGLSVATWDGSKVYEAGASIDFVSVIELLVKAKTANEESQTKRDFGRDKWERRRRDAKEGKIVTKTAPPWLKLSKDRSYWIELPERVEVVRRIFAMCDAGDGAVSIAKRLNEGKIAPWPRYANREPQAWSRGFVGNILTNPATIGDYVMKSQDDAGKLAPAGEPVRGYYPRIIEPDLFERVNAGAQDRKAVRGRRSAVVANLVSGLAVCKECGGPIDYVRGRAAGTVVVKNGVAQAPLKQETATLYCRSASRSAGCTNRAGIAYIGFERALLDSVLHLAMDDSHFARNDELGRLSILIADRRRDADAATSKARALWEGFAASQSAMAMNLASEAEKAASVIEAEIKTLEGAKAKALGEASAAEHLSRLAEVRSHLYSEDLDLRRTHRAKVAAGLRSAIDRIECKPDHSATVYLKVPGIVMITPGAGRRPASAKFINLTKMDKHHGDRQRIVERMKAGQIP